MLAGVATDNCNCPLLVIVRDLVRGTIDVKSNIVCTLYSNLEKERTFFLPKSGMKKACLDVTVRSYQIIDHENLLHLHSMFTHIILH